MRNGNGNGNGNGTGTTCENYAASDAYDDMSMPETVRL